MGNPLAKPLLCSLPGGSVLGRVWAQAGRRQRGKQGTEDKDLTWVFPHSGLFVLVLGQRQSLVLVFVGVFLLK